MLRAHRCKAQLRRQKLQLCVFDRTVQRGEGLTEPCDAFVRRDGDTAIQRAGRIQYSLHLGAGFSGQNAACPGKESTGRFRRNSGAVPRREPNASVRGGKARAVCAGKIRYGGRLRSIRQRCGGGEALPQEPQTAAAQPEGDCQARRTGTQCPKRLPPGPEDAVRHAVGVGKDIPHSLCVAMVDKEGRAFPLKHEPVGQFPGTHQVGVLQPVRFSVLMPAAVGGVYGCLNGRKISFAGGPQPQPQRAVRTAPQTKCSRGQKKAGAGHTHGAEQPGAAQSSADGTAQRRQRIGRARPAAAHTAGLGAPCLLGTRKCKEADGRFVRFVFVRVQKCRRRRAERPGQSRQLSSARQPAAGFPAGERVARHACGLGKLSLCKMLFRAQARDACADALRVFHDSSPPGGILDRTGYSSLPNAAKSAHTTPGVTLLAARASGVVSPHSTSAVPQPQAPSAISV